MTVVSTPATLLRAHPYGETSRILRFLTLEHGLVGVVGRGVRKRREGADLQLFASGRLVLDLRMSRELQGFREFEAERPRPALGADPRRLASASVLGEVVLRHAGEEGHPDLFEALGTALDRLAEADRTELLPRLLAGGWRLVSTLGYRPSIELCVRCGRAPGREEVGRFDHSAGGILCSECDPGEGGPRLGPESREAIGRMLEGIEVTALRRARAHLRLYGDFVAYHVSAGKPLRSLAVLASLVEARDGRTEATNPPSSVS